MRRAATIAEIVARRCNLTRRQVASAQKQAARSDTRLEVVLAEQKLVSESQMALAVAEYLERPVVSLANFSPDAQLILSVPRRAIRDLQILPLGRWGDVLAVSMADPFDATALEEFERMVKEHVVPYVAPHTQVLQILRRYGQEHNEPNFGETLADVKKSPQIELMQETDDEDGVSDDEIVTQSGQAPVIRIVNSMLVEALERGVSDIHVEPTAAKINVRYRIDGILNDQPEPPRYMLWAILSRLKIIAKVDIAERRLPQDGRFSIRAPGRDVDVRASFIPTVHGQKAVLRILDKANLKPNLEALDLDPADLDRIRHATRQSSGMILVTGPTGSGKTTTLYSVLQELNARTVNIITIEDPVEYQLQGINQIQAKPQIGLTFASGLRAILRQDPDVIMVGEIRDKETASISVQAALTGHLVLSTLHTNDAAGAVARLVHMGIEPFLLASSLRLAQAQRIYRKLCPACKEPKSVGPDTPGMAGIDPAFFRDAALYGPRGCAQCDGLGYRGRDAVMELLPADERIGQLIIEGASAGAIRRCAVEQGMLTLRQAGLSRVHRGMTSIEEILRVTSDVR